MNEHDEHQSKWDERNHNNCPTRFDRHTQWRIENMAQVVFPKHPDRGQQLVGETEAFLQGVAMPPADRTRRGDPGE